MIATNITCIAGIKTTGSAYISSDGKSITFNADLMDIGQEQDLAYEITNKSRQYDAKGSIECGFVDEDNKYNNYITVTPVPEEFEVDASRKVTGHVTLRMIQSFIGDNDGNDFANIEFKCTIKLDAGERDELAPETPEPYKDDILNGADPVLTGGLIPVSLTNDGKVIYADMYDKWYDYDTKRWANAVLLNDEYQGKYEENDVIPEDAIQSYFVWIPKFKYKLWNVDSVETSESSLVQSIDIVFDLNNTTDEEGVSCVTPMEAGESGNCNNGEYMTHPAFISFESNGIWVGKYEVGYKGATAQAHAQKNLASSESIIIKPDVHSWRAITMGNMFKAVYSYNRKLDSHLIKNTEWGAVAYLSHSEYGIDGRVMPNNVSVYKTGYAAIDINKYGGLGFGSMYNTENGYKASTTGNITGVYDMAGGASEYVASYVVGNYNSLGVADSSFVSKYGNQYFDKYPANATSTSYQNRILGDATGEMSPFTSYFSDWYKNFGYFVSNESSHILRGGKFNNTSTAGTFSFNKDTGRGDNSYGFRVVLIAK